MPLGAFSSCVWLVLLAANLMSTVPSSSCSSSSPSTAARAPSASAAASPPSLESPAPAAPLNQRPPDPPPPQSQSQSAAAAAAAAIPPSAGDAFCHHSISTEDLSPDCQSTQSPHQQAGMRITGDVNEGPGPPSCPASCGRPRGQAQAEAEASSSAAAASTTNGSCDRYLAAEDCEGAATVDWASVRLRHCCEHSVQHAVPDAAAYLADEAQCRRSVKHLLELDAFIAKVTCQFEQILLRFDCQQNYSVSSCQQCKVVYRRWVCAALIPHWRERHKIKPCRSICHAVEQKCPWFLPADKAPGYPAQYAGEPIFQCIDPNILESGEQLRRSTYGSDCCYEYCEQRAPSKGVASGYHLPQRSHHTWSRVGPCVRGCNSMLNDASTTTAGSEFPASCNNHPPASPATESAAGSKQEDGNSLSSCPSPEKSAGSGSSEGSSEQQTSTANAAKTGFSLVKVCSIGLFCFCFNVRVNGWR